MYKQTEIIFQVFQPKITECEAIALSTTQVTANYNYRIHAKVTQGANSSQFQSFDNGNFLYHSKHNWIFVQLNGLTINGARNTRSGHLISVLLFLGQALGQWGWACPDHHGSGSTACGLVLGVFSHSFTNGALLLHRIASVALQNKPQNTSF